MGAAFIKPKGRDSSFWKVDTQNRQVTQSGWGLDLGMPLSVSSMNGDVILGGDIKPNQKVQLNFGWVKDTKYHTVVRVNPEICKVATIAGYPNILEPGETLPVDLYLRADKAFNINDFTWLIRLYPID